MNRIVCWLLIVAIPGYATSVNIDFKTQTQSSPGRAGVNISGSSFYDGGQFYKNLLYTVNPGMEPGTKSEIVYCIGLGSDATHCTSDNDFDLVPENFFAGGSYTVAVGGNAAGNGPVSGCTGTILGNLGNSNAATVTSTYSDTDGIATFTSTAAAVSWSNGQVVTVRQMSPDGYNATGAIGNVTATTWTMQLAPGLGLTAGSGGYADRNPTYTFGTACAAPIQEADYVVIRKTRIGAGGPPVHWLPQGSASATFSSESADLHPGTSGVQAGKLDCSSSPDCWIAIQTFYDTTGNHIFILHNGTFALKFWAKLTGGSGTITASVQRGFSGGQTFTPTVDPSPGSGWQQFTYTFSAAEAANTAPGIVMVQFATSGQGVFLIDDVDIEKISGDATNTSVYRDEVVASLRQLQPGTLRIWDGQHGTSLDDWITPVLGRPLSGYGQEQDYPPSSTPQGLYDFLILCETVKADPWISYPTPFTTGEAANMIDFINGDPVTTIYGAKRAALGHPAGFASSFHKIYLECGNETWNRASGFIGENMPADALYGTRRYAQWAGAQFAAMKSRVAYIAAPNQFDMLLGCQRAVEYYCVDMHNVDSFHDAVVIEGYLGSGASFGTVDTAAHRWYPEVGYENDYFFNPADDRTWGNLVSALNQSPRPVPVRIYEYNQSTFGGTATIGDLDIHDGAAYNAAAEAAFALDAAASGVGAFQLWNLGQYSLGIDTPAGIVPIFGIGIDFGGAFNWNRPQFYGTQIVNGAFIGPMYATTIEGGPAFNIDAMNGWPAWTGVPLLRAGCFRNAKSRSCVFVNLDVENSQSFALTGDAPYSVDVTETKLSMPAGIESNNETVQNVSIVQQTLPGFNPASYTIGPGQVVRLDWSAIDPPRHHVARR